MEKRRGWYTGGKFYRKVRYSLEKIAKPDIENGQNYLRAPGLSMD